MKEYLGKEYIYILKTKFTKVVKLLNVDFHMLPWVSALSRTFSQQFRMQVDQGGKEVVKLK